MVIEEKVDVIKQSEEGLNTREIDILLRDLEKRENPQDDSPSLLILYGAYFLRSGLRILALGLLKISYRLLMLLKKITE